MPSYDASRAGVHGYTKALRAQLFGTGVHVTELVPPAVATAGQEKVNSAHCHSMASSTKRSASSPATRRPEG